MAHQQRSRKCMYHVGEYRQWQLRSLPLLAFYIMMKKKGVCILRWGIKAMSAVHLAVARCLHCDGEWQLCISRLVMAHQKKKKWCMYYQKQRSKSCILRYSIMQLRTWPLPAAYIMKENRNCFFYYFLWHYRKKTICVLRWRIKAMTAAHLAVACCLYHEGE